MSSIQAILLAQQNIRLGDELAPKIYRRKARLQATIQNERRELKYNAKSNRCGVCYQATSLQGRCGCDA